MIEIFCYKNDSFKKAYLEQNNRKWFDCDALESNQAGLKLFYDNRNVEGAIFVSRYEMLPNVVGHLIDEGVLDNKKIIVIYEDENGYSVAKFDKDGYLTEGWSFGYFLPDYDFLVGK